MAELGEFGLIAALSRWLPPDPRTLVGIGDDAAVLAAPDGRVVASTDFLLEGRHFRRDWSSATDIGRKAAARSLIDVAAMGAVPTGLLVALAAPPDLPVTWARDLAAGLAAECARAGANVVGGDTARASSVLLATTRPSGTASTAASSPMPTSVLGPGGSHADNTAIRPNSPTPASVWSCWFRPGRPPRAPKGFSCLVITHLRFGRHVCHRSGPLR